MADWKKIEAEYITTDTSYRKLARKYGLNQATIAQKAKAEDWVGKRKRQASTTQAKIISAVEGEKVNRAVRLQNVADKLLATAPMTETWASIRVLSLMSGLRTKPGSSWRIG